MENIYITKWEYCEADSSEIAALGQAGWEAYAYIYGYHYLKRPCGRIRLQEKKRNPEPSKQNPGYGR